jgi:hypothetical protein
MPTYDEIEAILAEIPKNMTSVVERANTTPNHSTYPCALEVTDSLGLMNLYELQLC